MSLHQALALLEQVVIAFGQRFASRECINCFAGIQLAPNLIKCLVSMDLDVWREVEVEAVPLTKTSVRRARNIGSSSTGTNLNRGVYGRRIRLHKLGTH